MKLYRRSLGMRALSVGCLLVFAAMAAAHFSSGGRLASFGGILLVSFSLLSLVASLLNLGDRYALDERGIRYENPLLERMGIRLNRSVEWTRVQSMRIHHGIRFGMREEHPSALFLDVAGERRFVIDSVEAFDEIQRLIAGRLGQRVETVPPPALPPR